MRALIPGNLDDICAEARIRAQLSTSLPIDITHFWHEVESAAFPLMTKSSSNTENREVTFLWRSEEALQGVYLRLNRVTDKKDVKKGLMTHIPSTDIWTLTLELPASYRGSYSFIEIPPGMTSEEISQLGGRFSPLPGQSDPFNKTSEINIRGFGESVLSLDLAPEQTEWDDTSHTCSGILSTSYSFVAGHQRQIRFYLPKNPTSDPLGLLVLPDAETWFGRIGITRAIDIAITTGRIAPMAILGIDNINESDRVNILGGNKKLILDIAGNLIPRLYKDYPDIVWAGRSNTILAGQSLGGVTALMAALYAPDIFGTVISHSPSMWWSPDRNTPIMFTDNDTSWVSKQVLSTLPKDVNIRLGVGSLEGATVPHVQQLHQSLLAAGLKSEVSVYTGGHDYAWWRGAIIDGLTDI
ncbi:alpha/beta hydrolase-fold protein [Raoultella sp. T31]|uniref:alpha/beta hydrolase-fold protein n=1 Tax=Raoultella sp. T31 TaxID=2054594 RepID=UPI000C28E632|nr:enterochelin esterase [Raoultella sp. T31]